MSDNVLARDAGDEPLPDTPPWFRDRVGPHPFVLTNKILPRGGEALPVHALSIFPWTPESIEEALWDGDLNSPELLPEWRTMTQAWTGALAFGGGNKLSVFAQGRMTRVKIPHDPSDARSPPPNIRSAVWALSQNTPLEPLIVFSGSSVLYVYNAKKEEIVGCLRGHGGAITSIAVHPKYPYLICTTSRDYTTRLYDLTLPPRQKPNNPHWPPSQEPSLAGAAHGLDMSDPEGAGIGCCVAVLVGGRSGGHQADVLGAAFHPNLPLIATCGLDRAVKIWRLPTLSGEFLSREDKPLFSSTRVHKSRVLSINWLSADCLISHCAPALMRREPDNQQSDVYFEPGTVVLWRWLGMNRFFPPGEPFQKILRGCAADYRESSSFKLVSRYSLPILRTAHEHVPLSPTLYVHQAPDHDPLLLFSFNDRVRILNVTHFSPRKIPTFPPEEQSLIEMTKRIRLGGGEELANFDVPPDIEGWDVKVETGMLGNHVGVIECCQLGMRGRVLVAGGSEGTIWIWRIKDN